MKIIGQLLIALIGGIVAILLYRTFENDDAGSEKNRSHIVGRNVSFDSSADSLNNVFNVGFGEAAEQTLEQVVHIRSRIVRNVPRDPFFEFFGDGFWDPRSKDQPQQQFQEASGSGVI